MTWAMDYYGSIGILSYGREESRLKLSKDSIYISTMYFFITFLIMTIIEKSAVFNVVILYVSNFMTCENDSLEHRCRQL